MAESAIAWLNRSISFPIRIIAFCYAVFSLIIGAFFLFLAFALWTSAKI